MATLLVVTHRDDRFDARSFLARGLFGHWTAAGHRVLVHAGPRDLPDADVAFLHIDCTHVPAEYVEATRRYRRVVNGRTGDVSKRALSQQLVTDPASYAGPVIVKTNRNSGGYPEARHASIARERGEAIEPVRYMKDAYPVFPSARHVPASVFADPELVVEKFLPEKDERGYYVRYWVFLGDKERCSRYLEARPIVKGDQAIERVPVPVPDEVRAVRRRLNLDYGKIDFVLHEGRAVVIDVNRTPTVPASLMEAVSKQQGELAAGIEGFVR